MYGRWQLGYMQLSHYVRKHNEFVDKMRAIDPTIKCVAVGDVGEWSEGMLKSCADHMDGISEHFYVQEKPGVMAHAAQVADRIRAKAEAHRRYRETLPSLKGKDIRIAMDEWNYWYGPHVFGELGTRYFQKDALGIAAGLHEFFRQSDIVFMANYAQTVNVIGCIKTSKTAAAFETTGLVLKLYREHYGTLPLQMSGTPQPLDVHAALTADRKTLTIGIVNPTAESQTLELKIEGVKLGDTGTRWQIADADPMAHNDPGQADRVKIEQSAVRVGETLTVAPLSVTVVAVPTK
jgi:alpha-N-arabinofuranosidase